MNVDLTEEIILLFFLINIGVASCTGSILYKG